MTGPVDSAAAPQPGGLRILLAEDHEINRKVAVLQLEKRGHRVSVATTGRQALERLACDVFDLVLMDITMPEMDGLQATREIRAGNVPGCPRDIPVVALTAHALVGDRERFLAAGMDGYLAKPIQTHELAKIIRQVLPGRAAPPSTGDAPFPGPTLAFDQAFQQRHFRNDPAFLQDLLTLYREDLAQKVAECEQALTAGDLPAIAKAAHTLAGASATVGAVAVREAAVRLSEVARAAADPALVREYATALRMAAELTLARLSDAANEASGGTP